MARQHLRCLALVYSQVLSWGLLHFVTVQGPVQMVQVAVLRSEWYYCQERCRVLGSVGRSPTRTLGLAQDLQSPWLQDQTRMCYRYSRRPPERPLGDQIPSRTHIPSSGAEIETQDRLLYHGEGVLGGPGRPLFHLRK